MLIFVIYSVEVKEFKRRNNSLSRLQTFKILVLKVNGHYLDAKAFEGFIGKENQGYQLLL
jgi:hypothetical protein